MNQYPVISILKDGVVVSTLPTISDDRTLKIGRHEDCNITIPSSEISRFHCNLVFRQGKVYIMDKESQNKTFINGKELIPNQLFEITQSTVIGIANSSYAIEIKNITAPSPQPAPQPQPDIPAQPSGIPTGNTLLKLLQQKGKVIIGRDPSCDLMVQSLLVSRQHAVIEKTGNEIYVTDLDSKNGTFINGQRITGRTAVTSADRISIASVSSYVLKSGKVISDYAIVADKIGKTYPNGYKGLREMSIKIRKGEFVALMGPSGCGKSTLLKGLNGANPVTEGVVTIQGLRMNRSNFDLLKQSIGYVPQDDIVHKELTVNQTMYYAAKLRVDSDVSQADIDVKIDEVLSSLNINDPEIRENKVGELSGGQRKRISIAVELLNDPNILFLDEPTSPLDPETIGDFLNCIRRLVKGGMSVVMVTHKPSDLTYVDKVIFLSKGGYLTFYGQEKELYRFFNTENIIDIYSALKTKESGKKWNSKWVGDHPLSVIRHNPEQLGEAKTESFFRQLYWLSRRYFSVKWNDKFNMFLLMAQPFIIAILICFIFENLQVGVLFLVAISAIWFGVSNAAKEIVGEMSIYERERMVNLNIWNYIFSKVIVLSIIAGVQVMIFMGIIYYNYSGSGDNLAFMQNYVKNGLFMFYLSLSATLLGLLLSAIFDTTEKVMTIVPIALIPQIMLAGVVAKIDSVIKDGISYLMIGRWGTEGFCWIQDNEAADGEGINVPGLPAPDMKESPQFNKESGIEYLDFYNENTLGLFEGFASNVLAIGIINAGVLILLYVALKRKDKRFV